MKYMCRCHNICKEYLLTLPHVALHHLSVVHWLALWFRNPLVAGSNPAEDGQAYELFREIALRIKDFFLMKKTNVEYICNDVFQ